MTMSVGTVTPLSSRTDANPWGRQNETLRRRRELLHTLRIISTLLVRQETPDQALLMAAGRLGKAEVQQNGQLREAESIIGVQ